MPKTPTFGRVSPLIPGGDDVEAAIRFYEERLGSTAVYRQGEPTDLAVVERGALQVVLHRNTDRRLADWTSFRVEVDGIDELYEEYQANGVIHADGQLETKPWGVREFAVLDLTGVCITFHEPLR